MVERLFRATFSTYLGVTAMMDVCIRCAGVVCGRVVLKILFFKYSLGQHDMAGEKLRSAEAKHLVYRS